MTIEQPFTTTTSTIPDLSANPTASRAPFVLQVVTTTPPAGNTVTPASAVWSATIDPATQAKQQKRRGLELYVRLVANVWYLVAPVHPKAAAAVGSGQQVAGILALTPHVIVTSRDPRSLLELAAAAFKLSFATEIDTPAEEIAFLFNSETRISRSGRAAFRELGVSL